MATKTRKPAQTFSRNEFEQSLDQIIAKTAQSLKTNVAKVYDKMTEDERAKLSIGFSQMTGQDEQIPCRLVKAILLAIGDETLKTEWLAETLRTKVSSVKRIIGKRY
jgi:hypothetical protein